MCKNKIRTETSTMSNRPENFRVHCKGRTPQHQQCRYVSYSVQSTNLNDGHFVFPVVATRGNRQRWTIEDIVMQIRFFFKAPSSPSITLRMRLHLKVVSDNMTSFAHLQYNDRWRRVKINNVIMTLSPTCHVLAASTNSKVPRVCYLDGT